MSLKWLLPGLLLVVVAVINGVSSQEEFYHLIRAHEAAHEMLYSFKVRVAFYGEYITNETEILSRILTDQITLKLESITTGRRVSVCRDVF